VSILNDIILEHQKEVKQLKFAWEEIAPYVDEDTNITDYILYSAKKIASKL
jgi:hypothetical protein